RNMIAENDLALEIFSSSAQNLFVENNFVENLSPLRLIGKRSDTRWQENGRGNYWWPVCRTRRFCCSTNRQLASTLKARFASVNFCSRSSAKARQLSSPRTRWPTSNNWPTAWRYW